MMLRFLRTRFENKVVEIEIVDGKIANIVEVSLPATNGVVQLEGCQLFPGFCDLQINGSFGHDFVTNPESIWAVATELPRFGVTSFLPTLVTCEDHQVEAAIEVLEAGPPEDFVGALPIGLHAEGPFLAEARKGAHDGNLMRPLSDRPGWLDSTWLKMMTLAPEREGSAELIETLCQSDVLVSVGHSEASADQCVKAIDQGARYGTHLFNAMSGLHHRTPGVAAGLLNADRAVCGMIVDGIHVHESMVKLAWRMKAPEGISLVSDAMAAAGMPEGDYKLSGFSVVVRDGAVRLPDGTLAGSALTLDMALRKFVEFTSCSWKEAVHTVTEVPAKLLGLPSPKLRVGSAATFTCIDVNGQIMLTVIDGEIAYQR